MPKSKSSRRWLDEHFADQYVKMAQAQGLRSRSAFKLIEVQEKSTLLKPGMVVVDLGAAPGGWAQLVRRYVGKRGQVIALDVLAMEPIDGVEIIEGDFTDEAVLTQLNAQLTSRAVDVVLSDMAPNLSGMKAIDQPRAMHLAELALDFALNSLKTGGSFLVKLFQGEGFDEYLQQCRQHFGKVVVRKPKASRPRSKEVYLLAQSFKPRD